MNEFQRSCLFGNIKTSLPVVALALLLATGIAYKFAPGLMSFDSLAQFRQVLGLRELNDAHPVIMVYLWRSLLNLYNHVGVLLFFHQLIYWLGIALFVCLVTRRILIRLVLLLLIGLCPPLIILSLHIWKDVGMMCALAISTAALLGYIRYLNIAWLIFSAVALFFAIAFRMNGFIPAAPILLLICYFFADKLGHPKWKTACLTFVAFICLSFSYAIAINLVNSGVKKTYGLGTLIVWDMVSISLAENKNLLPSYLPRSVADEDIMPALAAANSTEANYPSYKIVSPYPPASFQSQLINDWFSLVVAHPEAYFRHRFHILAVLLGIKNESIYYPYHPGIDENEFKIVFFNINNEELAKYFHFFDIAASSLLYRPWIYILISIITIAVAGVRLLKRSGDLNINLLAAVVASSGIASAGSMLFIATAADYRYITWTIFSALLACTLLFPLWADFKKSHD